MKFVDLQSEYKWYKKVINPAIKRVVESGYYLLGPELEEFEKMFAAYVGVEHAVGVKNCTDAITMLVKMFWGHGMPVILPNFGAYPTAVAVMAAGVNPYDIYYIDVDRTMTMDVTKLPAELKNGIIIPVHLFGNNCDIKPIMEYARANNHWVIEDCAQATGSGCGMNGHFSVFSFYPTKPLGCFGDGGMICSGYDLNDFKVLRFYGQRDKITVAMKGGVNSRMDELQAAILSAKLLHFHKLTNKRKKICERYLKIIKDKSIDWKENAVFHQFPILLDNEEHRKKVIELAKEADIPTMIHYSMHVSETEGCGYWGGLRQRCEVGYRVNDKILSFPCHAFMKEEEIKKVEDFFWRL